MGNYAKLLIFLSGLGMAQDSIDTTAYKISVDNWHNQRIDNLKKPDSWLSLAGLFWLKDGENSFGSDPSNDIVFPKGKAPADMGYFTKSGDSIWVTTNDDITINRGQLKITGRVQIQDESKGKQNPLSWGTLSWHVIKRGDRYGVRLKDSQHPQLQDFHGIERFPVNTSFRVEATLIPYDPPKNIPIANVLGQVNDSPCPGALEFQINDRLMRLDPLASPGDSSYFLVFADKTSGNESYGAGRYLSVPAPGADGKTTIDFNRAYNPPCAFSEYATCPLPPIQNFLPVAIKAGEKKFGDH